MQSPIKSNFQQSFIYLLGDATQEFLIKLHHAILIIFDNVCAKIKFAHFFHSIFKHDYVLCDYDFPNDITNDQVVRRTHFFQNIYQNIGNIALT